VLKPASGDVTLHGKSLREWSSMDVARRLTYLSQETFYLFPFTVEEVVLMGRFPHNASRFWDREADYEEAASAMRRTGTLKFAKRTIFELSAGERRKVEIARALCQKPSLLLLDEPTTFLDVRQRYELFELLKRLHDVDHISIVVASHQLELASRYVKKAVLIDEGRVVREGEPGELLNERAVAQFFHLPRG
jgi:iron complex transport system ATP-binding protein